MKVFSRILKRTGIMLCLLLPATGVFGQVKYNTRVRSSMIRPVYPSVRSTVIPLINVTALPAKTMFTKGWNGYTSSSTVYPLKISAVDTLFFNNQADMNYVKNAFTTAGIRTVT